MGSVDVVVDSDVTDGLQESVVETTSFKPFGERRLDERNGSTLNPSTVSRGFTDHEHLDEFGLIHMKGRVYDPVIGRFLSADPYVQDVESSQSWNRYSYVWNNPLTSSDPSGFFCIGICDINIPFTDIPLGFDLDWLSSDNELQPVNSFLNGLVGNDFNAGVFYSGSAEPYWPIDFARAENLHGVHGSGSKLGDIFLDQIDVSTVFESFIEDGVAAGAFALARKIPVVKLTSELYQGLGPLDLDVTKRTGPKGVDPKHHNANVMVKDANGNVVSHERVVSGNMTTTEKALGFPKNTLASHTEARAVTNTPLKAGDTMTITGQRPPCPSCKGYMNRANAETGANIRYQWRENGQTQRWTAGGN